MYKEKAQQAINRMKALLYGEETVVNIPFEVIWHSFNVGDTVPMEGNISLPVLEKGINDDGARYVTLRGKMPENSSFPRNQHKDAYELFICVIGEIVETVSMVKLKSGKSLDFRPGAHHGFKAKRKSEFICVITEVKQD